MESKQFHSSLELSNLATLAGRTKEIRASLEADLKKHGVDPSPALKNLPHGIEDKEAIVRLVALARGNGMIVNIHGDKETNFLKIVMPAGGGQQLQSGHH